MARVVADRFNACSGRCFQVFSSKSLLASVTRFHHLTGACTISRSKKDRIMVESNRLHVAAIKR